MKFPMNRALRIAVVALWPLLVAESAVVGNETLAVSSGRLR